MTQQEILQALNIDKTDPEAVKGAVAAVQALMTGTSVWPPPPPPPPTDPPLPMPQNPKKPIIDKRGERKKGSNTNRGDGEQAPIDDDEIRRITQQRTLDAARATLEKAEQSNADQDKIQRLKSAIAALDSLTEAAEKKSIKELSDAEFSSLINDVLDAIQDFGFIDDDLKIDTEEEHQDKVDRLETALQDDDIKDALEQEDADIISDEERREIERQQNLARIARAQNNYHDTSKYKDFDAFLNSLYKAIALQVQIAEQEEDSWTRLNTKYYGSGVLKKGAKINEIPSDKIPIIDMYFDVSGSWGTADIALGNRAVAALSLLEQKGKIKLNVFYFSNFVSTDYASVAGGGTYAWKKILDNIRNTKATNVVIMTDSDMNGQAGNGGEVRVKGCVWYLWKNGFDAPRIVKDLTGTRGTNQFAFSSTDAQEALEAEQANASSADEP